MSELLSIRNTERRVTLKGKTSGRDLRVIFFVVSPDAEPNI
jgi:hypothetical protein